MPPSLEESHTRRNEKKKREISCWRVCSHEQKCVELSTALLNMASMRRVRILYLVVVVACLAALLRIPVVEGASTELFHAFGNGYNEEYAEALIEHSFDTNIVMAGTINVNVSGSSSSDDFMLMKVSPVGVELWTKVKKCVSSKVCA
jgi:hypothetical protein